MGALIGADSDNEGDDVRIIRDFRAICPRCVFKTAIIHFGNEPHPPHGTAAVHPRCREVAV
ncbi:hypothetical protein GEV33_005912 [Tenebrio molitor]|jgi:hypothetical protein|uniref:Uncharacterized protein n=1 Tax=Tenebrio molitor TaxID=7067 RepID=A0A8J6LC76_TENMO|nr:hypothetical protein GEV33_005912 [Tenebrio molitor]